MKRKIDLFDIFIGVTNTLDFLSPTLESQHERVVYISHEIAEKLKFTSEEKEKLIIAAGLHDIGAFSLQERKSSPYDMANNRNHTEIGYALLKDLKFFEEIANIIRHHHTSWDGNKIPIFSNIIMLGSMVATLINSDNFILNQIDYIKEQVEKGKGTVFESTIVDAFLDASSIELFWFELPRRKKSSRFTDLGLEALYVDIGSGEFMELIKLFHKIIDFRSEFTATHSSGVAKVSKEIAKLLGFSNGEIRLMEVAGYLHDIGKVAIPKEILEKSSSLSKEEHNRVKEHVYFTYNIVKQMENLNHVSDWAGQHHEKIDGSGYCSHLKGSELSLGSKIMAVADTFTAMTEERPYRSGLTTKEVKQFFKSDRAGEEYDHMVVNLLIKNFDDVNQIRLEAQKESIEEYVKFKNSK